MNRRTFLDRLTKGVAASAAAVGGATFLQKAKPSTGSGAGRPLPFPLVASGTYWLPEDRFLCAYCKTQISIDADTHCLSCGAPF